MYLDNTVKANLLFKVAVFVSLNISVPMNSTNWNRVGFILELEVLTSKFIFPVSELIENEDICKAQCPAITGSIFIEPRKSYIAFNLFLALLPPHPFSNEASSPSILSLLLL